MFPQGTCTVMWLSWVCIDEAHQISPLKSFSTVDASHLKQGKRKLNEIKWLMKLFEVEAWKQSIWKEDFSAVEASFIYGKLFGAVVKDLGHCNEKGLGILSWQHVHNLLKAI